MTPYTLLYTLHVLGALIWVGSLFFAWVILRPAAASALSVPQRLMLWGDIFPRLFVWIWVAAVILPISGVAILHLRFSGFETAPRYIQVMMGLYLVMTALLLRVQALQVPALRQAVGLQDWDAGTAVLVGIRRLLGINLLIGLAVVAIAAWRPVGL